VPVVVVKMSRQRGRHKQVEKSNCTVCRRGGEEEEEERHADVLGRRKGEEEQS